ncbi:hypothetical protein niasHT_035175 [Heterodera trifolii]|uniref:Phosphoglycerate mutase n=1 Tax=Heterodera trifolii TaxID=157864 RepID=A0ABD2IWQ2_9BILA
MPSSADDSLINGPSAVVQNRLLWLVRHGQRVDNVDAQWRTNGALPRGKWDDPPLSARGLLQASEVGDALAAEPIHLIFCSPFTRCVQTAQHIVDKMRQNGSNLPSLCIEPGLAESLNACQSPPGFPSTDEILQSFPGLCLNVAFRPFIAADRLPTDERTNFCCFRRVIATLRHILRTFSGNVLIVSHGSPIAACHFALSGELNYPGQCTISKYRIPGGHRAAQPGEYGHWTDRWRNGQVSAGGKSECKRAAPLPPMGQSVVILGAGEERPRQRAGGGILGLNEALEGMAAAVGLCTGLNAESVAVADASHLSERKELHDALALREEGREAQ